MKIIIDNSIPIQNLSNEEAGALFKQIIAGQTPDNFKNFITLKKSTKISPDKQQSLVTICREKYFTFASNILGVPPAFNAAEGKALNSLISYLRSIAKNKEDTDVILALDYIFSHYSKWEPFHQKQLKLTQINSNITNIILTLKKPSNGKHNYDNSKYRPNT
jgi:hypothetical protein